MGNKRKQHSPEFKTRVALEALRGRKTLNELAQEFQIHPNLVTSWKKQLSEEAASLFENASRRETADKQTEATLAQLYQQIGQMKVEQDFLKKKLGALN